MGASGVGVVVGGEGKGLKIDFFHKKIEKDQGLIQKSYFFNKI